MRKVIILILVVLFVSSSMVMAKTKYKGSGDLGIGIVFGGVLNGGANAALSLKKWVNSNDALQGDVSWDFNSGTIGVGAAYLMHNFDIIKVDGSKMPLYIGIKGWAYLHPAALGIGIQVPLGIAWIPRNAPIDIFLQIEPGIMVVPATSFAGNGGLGIRYWF